MRTLCVLAALPLCDKNINAEGQRSREGEFISNANIMFELLIIFFGIIFARGGRRWNF